MQSRAIRSNPCGTVPGHRRPLLYAAPGSADDEVPASEGTVLLGFVQAGTENHRACGALLQDLLDRGLQIDQGLLVQQRPAQGRAGGLGGADSGAALYLA